MASLLFASCSATVESTSARERRAPQGSALPTVPGREESSPGDAQESATNEPVEPRNSGIATGRSLLRVELDPIVFDSPDSDKTLERIQGSVELCLTPELRTRQWNVASHPFRIDLGGTASLNVERMTKSTFSDVTVELGRDCPTTLGIPTLDVRIRSANRDPYWSVEGDQQHTAITVEVTFWDAEGEQIWKHNARGESIARPEPALALSPSGLTSRRHHHAAREFGKALEAALTKLRASILQSKKVRSLFSNQP